MSDLKQKVAIVTGARRGMGRTHALALASAGAKVVVSDISMEDCESVVKEIKENGGEALAVKCDVSKKEEVERMVKSAVDKWGRADILINNAGIVQFKPFIELTEEDWSKTIDINLKGYFLCAQAAAKEMIKQKSGVIVNIASKGGIAAMAEALAAELAPYNIRVNAIAPGAIETPMMESAKQDPKTLEGTLSRIPMHRFGKPEEVSNLVLFLASDGSSYMTGSTVVIDGGWLSA